MESDGGPLRARPRSFRNGNTIGMLVDGVLPVTVRQQGAQQEKKEFVRSGESAPEGLRFEQPDHLLLRQLERLGGSPDRLRAASSA